LIQTPRRLLYINVSGNVIVVEVSGIVKKTIHVKHNGVVVGKKKGWVSSGSSSFVVQENGKSARYYISFQPGGHYTPASYRVVRNGKNMLLI
jgi:hypothetical protein